MGKPYPGEEVPMPSKVERQTMVFTAVAEGTDDNHKDGACAGAAVGIVDKELQRLYRLERR